MGFKPTGSLAEARINWLGLPGLGFLEQSWVIFHGILHQGDQILVKPEMASARIQDGGMFALSCPVTLQLPYYIP